MNARRFAPLALILTTLLAASPAAPARAQALVRLRVGWCARTVTSAAAPFAVATKMGWYRQDGIEVEVVPLGGSTDCVKNVATREVPFSLPSVEPLAIGRAQGIRAKIYYTAYQGNIYGIAVPVDSPVRKVTDLRGKNIGVISMSSAGVIVARALVTAAGMNPDRDVNIVVAGEGAQTAAMVRGKQVEALSQYDTQYALVENAGVKLRLLDTKDIDHFPSNGFLALEETLRTRRKEAVALAKGYAMGTVFAIANPEAAVRILYEVFPHTRPTGKDEATAIREDIKVLEARAANWKLDKATVRRWGESSEGNYASYVDFMLKWGIVKEHVDARDLVTNELVDEINRFDPARLAAEARAWRPR